MRRLRHVGPGRLMRPAMLTLVILVLVPAALAQEGRPVAGRIFVEGASLDGVGSVVSWSGALDLAPAVSAGARPTLRAGAFDGLLVKTSWLSVGGQVASTFENEVDPLRLPGGELRVLACGTGCQALLVPEVGVVGLAGRVTGPLVARDADEVYCGNFCENDPDDFVYVSREGALLAGPGGLAVENATAVASGRARLFVYGALVEHVDEAGRSRVIDLRSDRSQTLPHVRDSGIIRTRFVTVTLDVAGLEGGADRMVLMGEHFEVRLDGRFRGESGFGTLRLGEAMIGLDHEPFDFDGVLRLILSGPSAASLLASDTSTTADVGGSVRAARVGAVALDPAPPPAAAPALLALALLALALLGLYSRIRRDRIFDNGNRARIASLLRERPGLTSREIAAALGIARVVVQHHLVILLTHRFVMRQRVGRADRYHAAGAPLDRAALECERTLKDPTRRRVAELIASRAGLTQAEVAAALGVSPRLVSYHLRRLEASDLVKAIGAGPRRYEPSPRLVELRRAGKQE